jgi:hypothetical protein
LPQVKQAPNKHEPPSKPQAFNLKQRFEAAEIQAERPPVRLRYKRQSATRSGKRNQRVRQIQQQIAERQIAEARSTFEEQRGFLQPYQEPGLNALARIQAGITPGGEFAQPFTAAPFQFEADPGYAFRLSEGQKALERQAAARGGLISGSALKAAGRFGQEMGSQEFQNAFARYQAERADELSRSQMERANVLNPLFALYGTGAETAGALSGAAGGMGSSIGGFLGQSGQAQAALDKRRASCRRRYYRRGRRGRSRCVTGAGGCGASCRRRYFRCRAGPSIWVYGRSKYFNGWY